MNEIEEYSDSDLNLSDDNDYHDFMDRMKAKRRKIRDINDNPEEIKKHVISADIRYGNDEEVLEELEKGLDPNIDLDQGWTPLLLASKAGNEKIMSTLLDKGVDVNQKKDDLTSLMLLCNNSTKYDVTKEKIFSCVKLLLKKGANVNLRDKEGRTAIMLAAYNGHLEIVKLLWSLVDKDAEDNQCWNVLFWAVNGNQKNIVEYIMGEGFDFDKTDKQGMTASRLARFQGYLDMLYLFPDDPRYD